MAVAAFVASRRPSDVGWHKSEIGGGGLNYSGDGADSRSLSLNCFSIRLSRSHRILPIGKSMTGHPAAKTRPHRIHKLHLWMDRSVVKLFPCSQVDRFGCKVILTTPHKKFLGVLSLDGFSARLSRSHRIPSIGKSVTGHPTAKMRLYRINILHLR